MRVGMRHEEARIELAARLGTRRAEIEQATLTRIYAISELTDATDPAYVEGLRAAVTAALDYGLAGIGAGQERGAPPPPTALLAQARLAARNRVSLDTVLRRYFAGYTLLGDFLIEEAQQGGLMRGPELKRLLRVQATLFDCLLAAVSEEYTREANGRPETAVERRAERVERLLAGELLDTSDLAYDFDATHIGLFVSGPGALETIRDLAIALDCRHLLVPRREGILWAWLGARRHLDPAELERPLGLGSALGLSTAVGEGARGLTGWRLTHMQARAALPIALRSQQSLVRYADVALLASILRDDLLITSLRQLYLAPLERNRDGGEVAKETLRAYFSCGRNASSTAAALGVNRNTVASRLRAIEENLGCPLDFRSADLETALRLETFDKKWASPAPEQVADSWDAH